MNIISRIVDFISNHSSYLILSPHFRSFGDSVEQIYFGLLYCIEREKKLILVSPYKKLFFKKINISNIFLYQLEHELIYKTPPLVEFILKTFMTLLVGIAYLNTKLRMIVASVFNLKSEFYANIDQSFASYPPFGRKFLYSFSEKEIYKKEKWFDLEEQYNPVTLPKELEAQCKKFLDTKAPESANKPWIVIHVLDNTKRDLARGADINDFNEAIQYLVENGYHVFRIGDDSMPRLDQYGVTDLAHLQHENFLDLYLIKKAKLFIGTQSGPAFATNLFKTPLLTTNLVEWSTSIPRKKGDFFLIKTFFEKETKKRLAISDLFKKDYNFQTHTNKLTNDSVTVMDNTKEDILEAVIEQIMFNKEISISTEQREFFEVKQNWLQKDLIENKDLVIHYAPTNHAEFLRIRSIALSSNMGSLPRSFLRKYWS